MNYKQIKEIKAGTWFEVLEDYIFDTEIGTQTIPKGTKMQSTHASLKGWRFRFDKPLPDFLGIECGIGRSRLLKMKLKKEVKP